MSRKTTPKRTRPMPKAVLRLPDLDQAKSAILNSLTWADAQSGYRHAIDEFVDWYGCKQHIQDAVNERIGIDHRAERALIRVGGDAAGAAFVLSTQPVVDAVLVPALRFRSGLALRKVRKGRGHPQL